MAITCKVCDDGEMLRTTIYRLGNQVAIVGYILFYLSAAASVFCLMGLYFAKYGKQPDDFSGSFVAAMRSDQLLNWLLLAGVGAVIGYLLLMKRQVLKCTGCGAVVDAG